MPSKSPLAKLVFFMRFFFLLALLFGLPTLARESNPKRQESALEQYDRKRPKQKNNGPCKVIRNACVHAGFIKDGARGKDVKKDCLEVLLLGGSVKGVHLIPGIISSCKANIASETGE